MESDVITLQDVFIAQAPGRGNAAASNGSTPARRARTARA